MTAVLTAIAIGVTLHGSAFALNSKTSSLDFDEYMTSFARTYARDSEEYAQRRDLFHQAVQKVQEHNAKPDRMWTAAINHLTDRTEAEFNELQGWNGRSKAGSGHGLQLTQLMEYGHGELRDTVDWRNLSSMQEKPNPNQKKCGSCWALATVNMLMANYEIKKKRVRTFSPQELIDCVPNPKECGGHGGCKGATSELAMLYVMEHGLADEATRPYQAQTGSCKSTSGSFLSRRGAGRDNRVAGAAGIGLMGWHTLPENQAEPLLRAINQGPVTVSVSAKKWKGYGYGVFNQCERDVQLGHAALLMGYGYEPSHDVNYWTILNSWGDEWGESGHIRLYRGKTAKEDNEYCGIDDNPKKGVECKPYRDQITVCGQCGLLYDSVAVHFNDQ